MLDYTFARFLGISRQAPPQMAVEYVLRQAGESLPDAALPVPLAEWLVGYASDLVVRRGISEGGREPVTRTYPPEGTHAKWQTDH